MNILVLNCGSSSIKYQLLEMSGEPQVLAKGIVERIGLSMGCLAHKNNRDEKYETEQPVPNHTVGIQLVLAALTDKNHGVISSLDEIKAVGHRVAHGGEYFTQSVLLDADAIAKIEACCDLAPLHNPAHLLGMRAIMDVLPNIPQTAVFDTSFHQSMPASSYMYPIPYRLYEQYKIRRYGFHGTSHKFVAEKACKILGWNIEEKKIITCHLGNGASITAIKNGKSVDTSMGFTPVEGLMMGTRTGDLDLGALLFIMEKENLSVSDANSFINKKCGTNGFSEISSDMRDLEAEAEKGNERAELTLQMYAHRVRKYIGAYAAVMNGVDLIIMTGGIGENSCDTRRRVLNDMEYLGLIFDNEKNKGIRAKDEIISKPESKVIAMTITTNEELVIAMDTLRLVNGK
ncbi:MAG TPA: acetate kinase [Bacteroidales bacterium]|jgi:acetate kinase|nr:acetate kinase [Bacteroidales bacterium]HOL98417.1 acetate kinase [Bacteroidales bacterium]HOM36684.1 acetate kinase [Bacteroidales bacterium]HPD24153.1 acetate kinase [Bacteroidales bacterium]HRT00140.1 acetate kinase [Bacteroidales bacterium]